MWERSRWGKGGRGTEDADIGALLIDGKQAIMQRDVQPAGRLCGNRAHTDRFGFVGTGRCIDITQDVRELADTQPSISSRPAPPQRTVALDHRRWLLDTELCRFVVQPFGPGGYCCGVMTLRRLAFVTIG